jgi:hypothetical protein
MEKHKLISLVNKTSSYFDEYSTPTSVYSSLWDDIHFKPLLERMSSEDIIFYSFLVPIKIKGQDIDETYDRIETNMFSVELVEIYNTEPEVDCPDCHNGQEPCDNCDGTGEEECRRCDGNGEEDCDYCGGSGMDEDAGEECDMCEGSGRMTCGRCNGSGEESCNYCGGDGETNCSNCDATGNIYSDEKVEVQYLDYISWSGRWKEYFFRAKPDEQLDYEDTKNFGFNSQTIYLGRYEEISEDYTGYENGDVLLYVTKDTKDLNLTKQYDRIYP